MTVGTYSDFFSALGKNESGNNYVFVSSLGYLGRFQFGEEALQAVGFYNGHDGTAAIDFIGGWTSTAASFGVWDKASFLQSAAAQDAAANAWFSKISDDLKAMDLWKYDDQWVNGVHVTPSGLIAGAHLVGVWALKSYLASGGQVDTRDGYGTPVSEYVHRFGDYQTPFSPGQPTTPAGNLDEVIAGGAAADDLRGYSGADTLDGGAGADSLSGGDGNDDLAGGPGANYLRGDAGDDRMRGGEDFDDLNGNAGRDTLQGGGGDDWVVGGKDDDRLFGEAGGDIVLGNLGADTCEGGEGGDQVRGGQGDDLVSGGAGADFVSGDRGNDTVSGGSGADVFHTFAEAGIDRVLDFNAAEGDRVYVLASGYSLSQAGADTVIDFGGENRMILADVQLSSLQPGWIF